MMDLYEAKAAVLAAKKIQLTSILYHDFDENGRSFTGCMPVMVATIED